MYSYGDGVLTEKIYRRIHSFSYHPLVYILRAKMPLYCEANKVIVL